jgi:hypothetical protein
MQKRTIPAIVRRVLARLFAAEAQELNPWYRDDLRIARLTVSHAAREDAAPCAPDVLASYEVLGLHPKKVWPAIQARRLALGLLEISDAPQAPKKPPRSVDLWCKENGARAANSHAAMYEGSPRTTISVPMAAPSIAALYPKSDASSSAKTRGFTYGELLDIVKFSGAPRAIKDATLNALTARGRWPGEDGPATGIICVSLKGMMLGDKGGAGNVIRSTARWRTRRACKLGYWRKLRDANSWSNCPNCGSRRVVGVCGKFDANENFIAGCGYQGRAKTPDGKANFNEFCRPFMYEIDIEKFRRAPRPKGLQHFERTYSEQKEAEKNSPAPAHPLAEVTPIRKPSAPATPTPSAPAAPAPARKAAQDEPPTKQPRLTRRESAKFIADMAFCMRGQKGKTGADGVWVEFRPGDPRYLEPMNWRAALLAVCKEWKRAPEAVMESLKFWGYTVEGEETP